MKIAMINVDHALKKAGLRSRIVLQIHDELLVYHQLFDIYNDYEGIQNLKTINDSAGKAAVAVDQKIIDLLEFSIDLYKKTNGN